MFRADAPMVLVLRSGLWHLLFEELSSDAEWVKKFPLPDWLAWKNIIPEEYDVYQQWINVKNVGSI